MGRWLIDPDKIKTHKGLTAGDLSHAVTCVLTDRFNEGLDEARLADCKNIADEFARQSNRGSARGASGANSMSTADASATTWPISSGSPTTSISAGSPSRPRSYCPSTACIPRATSSTRRATGRKITSHASAIGAARARMTGGSTSPPRTTGLSRVPLTSPRASSISCAPRRHDRREGRQRPRYAFRAQLPRGYLQYAAESPCRARGPRDAAARRVPGCQPVDDLPRRGRKRRHVYGQARNV